jgi:hypothetical protein
VDGGWPWGDHEVGDAEFFGDEHAFWCDDWPRIVTPGGSGGYRLASIVAALQRGGTGTYERY